MSTTIAHQETSMDTTADLADVLRTIASGVTAGMPTWTGLDHGAHDPGVVRLHLRNGDDVQQWAVWLLRRWAVAAHGRTMPHGAYTRHSRMAYAHGLTVELFHLERLGAVVTDG